MYSYFGRVRRIWIFHKVPQFVLQIPPKTSAEVAVHAFITIQCLWQKPRTEKKNR